MTGNKFGKAFNITTFGESHGGCVGAVVDGCPSGLEISEEYIQTELDRRKPGQSALTTPRKEEDKVSILSGVFEGKTTGTPIMLMAQNKDMRPNDYSEISQAYRPSHADYTYQNKYKHRDFRGSGRASARETLARVAGGAIAKKFLTENLDIKVLSYVESVGDIATKVNRDSITIEDIEKNLVRCPNQADAKKMQTLIEKTRDKGDSIGGVIGCVIKNVPLGLGEPVFDRINADLGKAMLSINAVKGFEIGSGFEGTKLNGSQHNDQIYSEAGEVKFKKNDAGGTLGGISTGEDIYFRVAFKPVATIMQAQDTVNLKGENITLEAKGRHDPCVLPRAVPIVDAMAYLTIMDHYLRFKSYS